MFLVPVGAPLWAVPSSVKALALPLPSIEHLPPKPSQRTGTCSRSPLLFSLLPLSPFLLPTISTQTGSGHITLKVVHPDGYSWPSMVTAAHQHCMDGHKLA